MESAPKSTRTAGGSAGRTRAGGLGPGLTCAAILVLIGVAVFAYTRSLRDASPPARPVVTASAYARVGSVPPAPVTQETRSELSDPPTPRHFTGRLVPPSVAGFDGDNTQAPALGSFSARDSTNSLMRTWTITRACTASCAFTFSRTTASGTETGQMVLQRDGWHVNLPQISVPCECPQTRTFEPFQVRSSFVIRFSDGGRTAVANSVTHYENATCDRYDHFTWTAGQEGV